MNLFFVGLIKFTNIKCSFSQNHIQSEQKIEGSNKHILFNPSEVLIGRKCAMNADEKLSIERKRKMSSDIKREIGI